MTKMLVLDKNSWTHCTSRSLSLSVFKLLSRWFISSTSSSWMRLCHDWSFSFVWVLKLFWSSDSLFFCFSSSEEMWDLRSDSWVWSWSICAFNCSSSFVETGAWCFGEVVVGGSDSLLLSLSRLSLSVISRYRNRFGKVGKVGKGTITYFKKIGHNVQEKSINYKSNQKK